MPLRNQQGSYDEHVMPDLPTSSAVGDDIQTRAAACRQHLQRHLERRAKQAKAPQPSRPAPRAKGRRDRKR